MKPTRFAGLDHLRALAIVIVFVYHYSMFGHPAGLYEYLGNWGWTGVDLFFVLSGYLIGGQLFAKIARDQRISFSEFYVKRSLRILPAYFAVLALYIAIPAFSERSRLPPLWRMFTFTQNFGLDLSKEGAFSHAWSLCIEEQFYLVLPLLIIGLSAIRAHKKAVYILPALFLFGLAIRSYIWSMSCPDKPASAEPIMSISIIPPGPGSTASSSASPWPPSIISNPGPGKSLPGTATASCSSASPCSPAPGSSPMTTTNTKCRAPSSAIRPSPSPTAPSSSPPSARPACFIAIPPGSQKQ